MSKPVVRIAVVIAMIFIIPWNIVATIFWACRDFGRELYYRMREDFEAAVETWRTGKFPSERK